MGTNVPVSEKAQFRAITVDKLKKKCMTRWASLGEAADIKAIKGKKITARTKDTSKIK